YALLGDAGQPAAADRIFELKRRPRAKTLSLVTDPRFWAPFLDQGSPALTRFPLRSATALYTRLHALGVVYPAHPTDAPGHLVQSGTILNVWSRYRPLIEFQEACRERGVDALCGASANPSGQPTYTTAAQMARGFGDALPIAFAEQADVPVARRESTSLLDLTGGEPCLLREGNTTEAEVGAASLAVGLGPLAISPDVVRLR
ncbi:MAG: Sua5/YciO/YrdC/YwlC family protein, partial [Actinomycetota bacterium]